MRDSPRGFGRFLRFRSFRGRILFFFLSLLLVVQVGAFLAVDAANNRSARGQIHEDLVVGSRVFARLVEGRTQQLIEAARLLGGDYAFKAAFASQDIDTVVSALRNHQSRIDSDMMMLFSLDAELIASTLRPAEGAPELDLAALVEMADDSDSGEAAAVLLVGGRPFRFVLVPLLAPLPVAWIAVAFVLDDRFSASLRRLTLAHVSLVGKPGDGLAVHATTLPPPLREALPTALAGDAWQRDTSFLLDLGGQEYVTLVTPLTPAGGDAAADGDALHAVLQRSLDQALAPYDRLRAFLLGLIAVALTVSLIGAGAIARGVTKPVLELVAAARKVEAGDYTETVAVEQRDEIGELSDSFNRMTRGLAERDKVRDMLGKVVDPAVAEELLSREVALGGEEREVSVLFNDIRGFTALSEQQPPQDLVAFLNTYLTRMTEIIEANGGIVDKYIGDAIMALFGAPLPHGDDPARAVRTALAMQRVLGEVNRDFAARGLPVIDIGVGINTGVVVTGNMGSRSRLNYTVIGDGVNLAARVEGLTRIYGVPAIVTESTMRAAPAFVYRELDRVRVKGRQGAVGIYEPLGENGAAGEEQAGRLRRFHEALELHRERKWDEAEAILVGLGAPPRDRRLVDLYRARIARYRLEPPPADWDGSVAYGAK
ncbi:MAG: adenylate/guanylate cyclase domain-containing protein [Alphaproteobacteria bacterium]|jgi:adenylate cyclase|nr:adenylate/guanylate cyclase domain-containing protein [Alphaproteobacteria bacterium]MDP6517438.1 adenylate/guanylate cyclase domain-containing protein [Alphaproteobacteria bacterium]